MLIERDGRSVRINPSGRLSGAVRPPGSKSLTNRLLSCVSLADGQSELRGVSLSDDAFAMLNGLERLGVRTDVDDVGGRVLVHGCNGNLMVDEASLDVGHAGTAMRFLTALVCLGHGRFRVDGSARMRQRPIGPLVGALSDLGARIGYEAEPGYPPLNVLGEGLRGGRVRFDEPPSSQYISALLMVAPYSRQDVMIEIGGVMPSRPYVDMTIDVMRELGVELVEEGGRFIVPAMQRYRSGVYDVEPDASAATYLWAAAAVTGGSVTVEGLSRESRQGDVGFVDVLDRMGCEVSENGGSLSVTGPAHGQLHGIEIDLNSMPDTVQTLAVVALFADGPTEIANVANLRIKETDRIAALERELTKLGARVDARPDGLRIEPPEWVRAAEIDTYDDHRMAMSFTLAGLAAEGVVIRDADVVTKSFPGFYTAMASLSET